MGKISKSVEIELRLAADRQDGLVTARQAVAAGLSRNDIRALRTVQFWRRAARGVYAIGTVEPTARQSVYAAALSVGPDAVVCGRSAALLWGMEGASGNRPEIAVSADRPHAARSDILVRQLVLPPYDLTTIGALAVTTPFRTVAELLCRLPRVEAVSILDSALHRRLIAPNELSAVEAAVIGQRGAVGALLRLAECDGRAASPLETRIRLVCNDGQCPPDELQHAVKSRTGELIGVGDLYWREARLIGECDGAESHESVPALLWDRRRANEILLAGYRIVRFTWVDTQRPAYVLRIVRQALEQAA